MHIAYTSQQLSITVLLVSQFILQFIEYADFFKITETHRSN